MKKKTTDYDHGKFITTQEFNSLTTDNSAARLKEANLASRNNIANLVRQVYFDKKTINYDNKITSNKTKLALIQNELNKP